MTQFLLLRHAEPDYSHPVKWKTRGWGTDLAPLSPAGEEQVRDRLSPIRLWQPDLVLCSPMTRALQSALIIRDAIEVPFIVEFDLHEWVPDRQFRWQDFPEVKEQEKDLELCNGEWPDGGERPWEPLSKVRARCTAVLSRYLESTRVLVVTHQFVIRALTGEKSVGYTDLVPFVLNP